ncbi:mitochondrial genome maintenance exonuclease 1 [Trichonephila clavata]|uniref:Mitochondrial genome maintenance exonuclease 1 n=1 Tax=Trichonephila clavata TaxID=2740835 RepID=A0A8X6GHS7_TRICU|nr:mitochondrial genome maintenance exonuclease 1 [Trichonephila clavata]
MECKQSILKWLRSLKSVESFHIRYLSYSNITDSENNDSKEKKKGKISVLVKHFPKDMKGSPVILEAKDAFTVKKQLNHEFKMLYGPVQNIKVSIDKKKFPSDSTLIQNQTLIPIVEPNNSEKLNSVRNLKTNENFEENFSLNWVLNFPLLNQQPSKTSEIDIAEINSLRKELEKRSRSYVPSVSKILEKTMPQESAERLRRWKENMIKELGIEGFQKYQEDILKNGQNLHTYINAYLGSIPKYEIKVEEAIAGHWESLRNIFPYISDIKLLEERISHPFLCYKGIVDCFARYKGKLVVIDWKTSKKKKLSISNTFDNPLQIAAYVGALNFDPRYQYLANQGLIVVAYEDGTQASAHYMDTTSMGHYWKEWLIRVQMYWKLMEENENIQS